ncbi:glycosyltransferase [Collinsella ihumii]|uniref:glycosyltransferase n=1 Tax=Collinsella ihumii TaxID=1720204 RepID=UPI0025AA4914|nr:glycosyltransferase [Collinsella ihumii]MDN0055082.1 glycosyltransferase [Collinsella ihumii]
MSHRVLAVRNSAKLSVLRIYGKEPIDLFVNVSESEGLPISIMEACGVGAPVLATDVGGTCEIVFNELNGRLLPANPTSDMIAQAITWLMDMPVGDFKRMRRASRCVWEDRFRAVENARQLIEVLQVGEFPELAKTDEVLPY